MTEGMGDRRYGWRRVWVAEGVGNGRREAGKYVGNVPDDAGVLRACSFGFTRRAFYLPAFGCLFC